MPDEKKTAEEADHQDTDVDGADTGIGAGQSADLTEPRDLDDEDTAGPDRAEADRPPRGAPPA